MGLLSPYRILDLADEKGVVCGRVLADLGADVIKVERPGGDPCRHIGPFYHDIAEPEKSLFWFAYNANKRGITLDLETTEGRDIFKKLVRTADAVVESFPPGYMDRLELGYGELAKMNPGIIVTSISPFGQTGPHKHFKGPDLITWGMGGMIYVSGDPDRPPVRLRFPQSYPQGGAIAAAGTAFALFHRGITGEGQQVDVSIQAQVVRTLMNARQFWDVCGTNLTRAGQSRPGANANQRLIWPCKDGYISFSFHSGKGGAGSSQALVDWMRSAGVEDAYLSGVKWPELDLARVTQEQLDRIAEPMGVFFRQHTMAELFAGAMERGIMLYPVYTPKEIVEDVQLHARRFWTPLEHPELGATITYPGAFVKLSDTYCGPRRRAPLIGEHNQEVFAELGLTADANSKPPSASSSQVAGIKEGAAPTKVFEGLKVADFAWVGAGPATTKLLAEHGATVIRIETINRPDTLRITAPFKDGIPGIDRSAYYACFNNDKLSLALDLQHPKAGEIARRLVQWSDIVAESFSPGTIGRWGLDYENLKKIKPEVIMFSTSQQGQTGPHARIAAYGTQLVSLAGFTWLGGWPDRGPTGPYGPYTDTCVPPVAAAIIAAALDHRRRTGQGIHIDLSQYETSVNFLAPVILDYIVNGRVQNRQGNRCPDAAPHGVFPCKGHDRWCTIAVFSDEEWLALREAMGDPAWAMGVEFASLPLRKQHADELERQIATWTAGQTAEEVMCLLQGRGVPAGVVQNAENLHNDPQLAHRHFLRELEHAEIGKHSYEAPAFKLSKTPAELERAAPCLGQDTEFVCTNILGLSDEEFAQLMAEGLFE